MKGRIRKFSRNSETIEEILNIIFLSRNYPSYSALWHTSDIETDILNCMKQPTAYCNNKTYLSVSTFKCSLTDCALLCFR